MRQAREGGAGVGRRARGTNVAGLVGDLVDGEGALALPGDLDIIKRRPGGGRRRGAGSDRQVSEGANAVVGRRFQRESEGPYPLRDVREEKRHVGRRGKGWMVVEGSRGRLVISATMRIGPLPTPVKMT